MVWFVRDVCGICCLILAWSLMTFSQYTLLTIVLLPLENNPTKYVHIFIFEWLAILTLISHIRTIFTDPGSVPRGTATPQYMQELSQSSPPNHVVYKCSECRSIKPDRAHHCSVCHRCISKMDHHCPWINNCVGERNQKFFVLFTFYASLLSIHALVLSFGNFFECIWTRKYQLHDIRNNQGYRTTNLTSFNDVYTDTNLANAQCSSIHTRSGRPSPENLIMLVFLIFEALLIALFGFIMFCIQMKSIWSDWTGIEHLKKETRNRRSGCNSMKSVFGSNILTWLSPLTQAPPANKSYLSSIVNDNENNVTVITNNNTMVSNTDSPV